MTPLGEQLQEIMNELLNCNDDEQYFKYLLKKYEIVREKHETEQRLYNKMKKHLDDEK